MKLDGIGHGQSDGVADAGDGDDPLALGIVGVDAAGEVRLDLQGVDVNEGEVVLGGNGLGKGIILEEKKLEEGTLQS